MLLIPSTTAMFQRSNMLASDGRCKTLSDAADGYVRADSVGSNFITSEHALRSQAIAFVSGTSVNQDGRYEIKIVL